MIDQSTIAYFESLRRLGELQEEHWEDDILPFDQALEVLASARAILPPEPFDEEEWADVSGFSNLLKTLELLRV
jgi:hypothetical protein